MRERGVGWGQEVDDMNGDEEDESGSLAGLERIAMMGRQGGCAGVQRPHNSTTRTRVTLNNKASFGRSQGPVTTPIATTPAPIPSRRRSSLGLKALKQTEQPQQRRPSTSTETSSTTLGTSTSRPASPTPPTSFPTSSTSTKTTTTHHRHHQHQQPPPIKRTFSPDIGRSLTWCRKLCAPSAIPLSTTDHASMGLSWDEEGLGLGWEDDNAGVCEDREAEEVVEHDMERVDRGGERREKEGVKGGAEEGVGGVTSEDLASPSLGPSAPERGYENISDPQSSLTSSPAAPARAPDPDPHTLVPSFIPRPRRASDSPTRTAGTPAPSALWIRIKNCNVYNPFAAANLDYSATTTTTVAHWTSSSTSDHHNHRNNASTGKERLQDRALPLATRRHSFRPPSRNVTWNQRCGICYETVSMLSKKRICGECSLFVHSKCLDVSYPHFIPCHKALVTMLSQQLAQNNHSNGTAHPSPLLSSTTIAATSPPLPPPAPPPPKLPPTTAASARSGSTLVPMPTGKDASKSAAANLGTTTGSAGGDGPSSRPRWMKLGQSGKG